MNELTMRPDRLERLRKICLALPEATEKIAWGDPTWCGRENSVAMANASYPGGRPSGWMRRRSGAQEALITLAPEGFRAPAYVGHKGWIGAWMDRPRIKWSMLEGLNAESHGLVGTKQKRRARR